MARDKRAIQDQGFYAGPRHRLDAICLAGPRLAHLAQGQTNKDIAQALLVSVRTVEAHVRNLFSKLGVRSRTEAALWAVRHGRETSVK
ncbi:MAG: response regulator transcription factor [Anaerolineales bacterium]|nr:response regulator transcription factor [Anaerolineales bacterium]